MPEHRDCLACGAPSGYPAAGPCRNHGTPQAILITAGATNSSFYIVAKGDVLRSVYVDESNRGS